MQLETSSTSKPDAGVVAHTQEEHLAHGSAGHAVTGDDDLAGYLREQSRYRRRRLMIAGGIAGVVVAAIVAVIVFSPSQGPQIDRDLAGKIREAIPHVSLSQRPSFAAEALSELEAKRLPAPMLEALRDASNAPPEYIAMSLSRALLAPEVKDLWQSTCAAGPGALAEALTMERTTGLARFCDACSGACARVDPNLGSQVASVAFAALAAKHLSGHGRLHSVERDLLRMLAE